MGIFKLALVFGTRPEAIKMAPLVKECHKVAGWETKVIVTGQHREMLDQVLDIFQITPDYDLAIMSHGQSLADITRKVLAGMEQVFQEWKPDLVLVHGDTSTAFTAALAAFYWQIPVGHVEAGLRTESLFNPFPEEANRRLTDVLTTWYFAPTKLAAANLAAEGVDPAKVFVTGNTVIDALLTVVDEDYQFSDPALQSLDFSKPVLVVTAHRRENWGEPLNNICAALLEISAQHDCTIVVAMHRNPALQQILQDRLGKERQIRLIQAPDYREFANLLARCTLILTDSGGLQEEAPSLHKPVLVLREVTERPEGVEAGTLKLVGHNQRKIVDQVNKLLEDSRLYQTMSRAPNPYGDGKAAQRIREILEQKYK